MPTRLIWLGDGAPRMEIAHVEQIDPEFIVSVSEQHYEPLGDGVIRFRAGDFVSDITFDSAGFVVDYPGIGARP